LLKYYQNEVLGHLSTYQLLIIDEVCIITCHKLIVMKSFISKQKKFTIEKELHKDSIFHNLHDFLNVIY
jgi:ATP adenylyltransferase/5',5'''-P-1,P-4-tetraphosphate phosphorylase II